MWFLGLLLFFSLVYFDVLISVRLGQKLQCTTIRVVSGILLAMFFLAESKFVHDLNFDFLFEHLTRFLIVDFCFRTLDFNHSFVCNV